MNADIIRKKQVEREKYTVNYFIIFFYSKINNFFFIHLINKLIGFHV